MVARDEVQLVSSKPVIRKPGRPGFDKKGVAVIMTSKDKQAKYEDMSKGQEIVESQLLKKLHEGLQSCVQRVLKFA
eukprot:50995-Eustigmatos_ZCMA.PRE.1